MWCKITAENSTLPTLSHGFSTAFRTWNFAREVFASSPDQVIVVHLTASRPGQISFEARMQTPQRASVEATLGGDLVMRGVNGDGNGVTADGKPIPGALRFEARVRILSTGGTRSAGKWRCDRAQRR
jgi:alpha-L-fucosidase 2